MEVIMCCGKKAGGRTTRGRSGLIKKKDKDKKKALKALRAKTVMENKLPWHWDEKDFERIQSLAPWEMGELEFDNVFGIHAIKNPDSTLEDKIEITRPGQKRIFLDIPIVVVRSKHGKPIVGEQSSAVVDANQVTIVTKDQKIAELFEQGYQAVQEAHKKGVL